MFYIHGKFDRNRMKISEVEAYWCFCMHFWQACVAAFDLLQFYVRIPCGAPPCQNSRVDGLEIVRIAV
jgi:hypothetical protein